MHKKNNNERDTVKHPKNSGSQEATVGAKQNSIGKTIKRIRLIEPGSITKNKNAYQEWQRRIEDDTIHEGYL